MADDDVASLDIAHCRQWADDGNNLKRPSTFSIQCPFCGDWAAFALRDFSFSRTTHAATAYSICPGCNRTPQFLIVYPLIRNEEDNKYPHAIKMYPAHKISYEVRSFPQSVPEALAESMQDTVRAYNSRIYGAAATSGGRTLEGIFKNLVHESKRDLKLHELIREVEATVNFKEPISRLSDAVRSSRNIGAHFDFDRKIDEVSARQIIELLDYLIDYLYVLPERIKKLEDSISKSNIDIFP